MKRSKGEKFCFVCGTKLIEKSPKQPIKCECGVILPHYYNYCPFCGKKNEGR